MKKIELIIRLLPVVIILLFVVSFIFGAVMDDKDRACVLAGIAAILGFAYIGLGSLFWLIDPDSRL